MPSGSIGLTVPIAEKSQHLAAAAAVGPGTIAVHHHPMSDIVSHPAGGVHAIADTLSLLPSPEQVPEMPDAPEPKQEPLERPLSLASPVPLARFMGGVIQTSKSNDPIDIKKPLII